MGILSLDLAECLTLTPCTKSFNRVGHTLPQLFLTKKMKKPFNFINTGLCSTDLIVDVGQGDEVSQSVGEAVA